MNNKTLRILYLIPNESCFGFAAFVEFSSEIFVRMSNYLHSKKNELNGTVLEEYIDLRIEGFTNYFPEEVTNYRNNLKNFLLNVYERFQFNIVAISCHSSFSYLNSIEVINMIKHHINPSCLTIIGGIHASICPQDYFPENIPEYFSLFYPERTTPIDYIGIDEGEILFFHFIRDVLNGTVKKRKNLRDIPIILEPEIVKNLDDLPLLDISLLKKYRKEIEKRGLFNIQFSRGCSFRCGFCPTSGNHVKSSKIVRFRSLEKCIADLKIIINTKWLSIKKIKINDTIFFAKKSLKKQFFNELEKLYNDECRIPFQIIVFDRIDLCTLEDLENYKKHNMIPLIGLESSSATLLKRINKISKSHKIQDYRNYVRKTKDIIKKANELELDVQFSYMVNVPGTDKDVISEQLEFFFSKNNSEKSLMETYKIDIFPFPYVNFYDTFLYEKGEEMFGAKYYFKEWWKIFDKEQYLYSSILQPSETLTYPESIKLIKDFFYKIYKSQKKLHNNFYFSLIHRHLKFYNNCLESYENLIQKSLVYNYANEK